jgi:hypothetical protein
VECFGYYIMSNFMPYTGHLMLWGSILTGDTHEKVVMRGVRKAGRT